MSLDCTWCVVAPIHSGGCETLQRVAMMHCFYPEPLPRDLDRVVSREGCSPTAF